MINQICAFLLERGFTVRLGLRFFQAVGANRPVPASPRNGCSAHKRIIGYHRVGNRLHSPPGVREAGGISLGCCQPSRVQESWNISISAFSLVIPSDNREKALLHFTLYRDVEAWAAHTSSGIHRGQLRLRIRPTAALLLNLPKFLAFPGVPDLQPAIHVVDDDPSFRAAISRLLQKVGFEVTTYESAQKMLDQLPDQSQAGCILLDVQIPGLSGPELQARLAERGFSLPIVFLSGHGDISTTVQVIKAGAEDFLTKPVTKKKLLDAIERAIARNQTTREARDRLSALRALLATLTPRERQVFELVVGGKMNKQIGPELGATERSIKAHRQKVMQKMKAQSLAELVSIADRLSVP